MQKMSTQWNQQLNRYIFKNKHMFRKIKHSNKYKIFEKKKKIDYKKPLRQNKRIIFKLKIIWVQNIQIEVWAYKAVECLECTCSFSFYLFALSQTSSLFVWRLDVKLYRPNDFSPFYQFTILYFIFSNISY